MDDCSLQEAMVCDTCICLCGTHMLSRISYLNRITCGPFNHVIYPACLLQRQKKRDELVAELEAQIEGPKTSMNPPILYTPANLPLPVLVPCATTFLEPSSLHSAMVP